MNWIPQYLPPPQTLRRSLRRDAPAPRRAHRAIDAQGMSRARSAAGSAPRLRKSHSAGGAQPRSVAVADAGVNLRPMCASRCASCASLPDSRSPLLLTLALAIGANAVVFGVLNALILRPLNVPHAQSLYTSEHGSDKEQETSYPDYLDLRDRNRSFED